MTMTPRRALTLLLLASLPCFPAVCHGGVQSAEGEVSKGGGTGWSLSPSFKFDALCFLNIMSGDPFYLALPVSILFGDRGRDARRHAAGA